MQQADRDEELFAIGTELLKRKDSARGRLILARVKEDLGEPRQAEAQVRAALNVNPDHFTANVALAMMLLEREDDPGALAEAVQVLEKADRFRKNAATPDERARYTLARVLAYSRAGELVKARWVVRLAAEPAEADEEDEEGEERRE
jgi:hypothetical protein